MFGAKMCSESYLYLVACPHNMLSGERVKRVSIPEGLMMELVVLCIKRFHFDGKLSPILRSRRQAVYYCEAFCRGINGFGKGPNRITTDLILKLVKDATRCPTKYLSQSDLSVYCFRRLYFNKKIYKYDIFLPFGACCSTFAALQLQSLGTCSTIHA